MRRDRPGGSPDVQGNHSQLAEGLAEGAAEGLAVGGAEGLADGNAGIVTSTSTPLAGTVNLVGSPSYDV
jgi:hypothetical protein